MKRRRTSHIVLSAGGTGGHMFPAVSLKDELIRRGHRVTLITDERGLAYRDYFKDVKILTVKSATFAGKGLLGKIGALFRVLGGIMEARSLLSRLRPGAVVGFGGYPSLPALRAAVMMGIPACLHEQNAVLGRVNRYLAKKVDAVALSFENTLKADWEKYKYVVVTGNPVRQEIVDLGDRTYPPIGEDRIFRILVIGGSQGARIFSEVVPAAISTLPRAVQRRLQITQQCRQEDIEAVRTVYADTKIAVELSTFIANLPECMEWAHLVIGRAGASTISELTAAGRPGILVPYPHATDDHQMENAKELVIAGGAWIFHEKEFNPSELAKMLQRLAKRPRDVWRAAEDSRRVGKPYAVKDLADLVERLALVKGDAGVIKTNELEAIHTPSEKEEESKSSENSKPRPVLIAGERP
ncbi:undecaprenyldiphospho-muramoylpentapeptide beta-N-acetylglucosaminyltransferase [Emcibacter sp.]|uniref:undecaprenyldiphospho-muramoylpentapeptide beta-N-acetylglucosaminyltransferase n=1 Tax=Emcibacter sp. TaxID=1979954 RepID=UPI003A8DBD11